MTDYVSGGCLCGDFKYQLDREQVMSAHHCHCKDCQKMTGSGKATIVMAPTEALVTEGELKVFTVVGTDGAHVTRGFCPNCGSQLISYLEEMPMMRFVKAGSLDDSSWVKIDSTFWAGSAEDWSPVDDSCQFFEGNPPT
jgi:hypothetical protein